MKRVDTDETPRSSTIGLNQIKIPTSSSITLTPSISGHNNVASAAVRFPARQVIEMPQQPVANATAAGGSAQQPAVSSAGTNPTPVTIGAAAANLTTGTFQRIPAGSGSSVSVFRGDSVPQPTPPAAHSGVALNPAPGRSSTQPAPPAHLSQTQPSQQNKPETIALPTTPVSVQYTGNAFAGATVPMPPSVKSLTNAQPVVTAPSVPGIVHNLTQQQPNSGHQQIVHQKTAALATNVSYGPPAAATIRTIASLPASTTAGIITTPVSLSATGTGLVAQTMASSAVSNVQTATNTASGAQQPQAQNAQFQRLKVEDALSYLDKVKYQFDNQPQVYNRFLDIMKEFKTQSIDTPGVIARVSLLFKGHPELIVGFNTFLPTGYKVEVHCNDSGSGNLAGMPGSGMQTIVHTPHGIHTMGARGRVSALTTAGAAGSTLTAITTAVTASQQQLQVRPSPIQPPNQTKVAYIPQPKLQETTQFRTATAAGAAAPHLPPQAHAPPIATLTQHQPSRGGDAHSQATLTLQTPHLPVPHLPNHPHPPPAPIHGATNQPEFNHAINYVNKIKNRFQGQPEVYKQFLEILHTYQRDQKAIKDGMPPSGRQLTEQEVHQQVSKLFKNQSDLLQEFSQFLPEATNDHATNALSSLSHKGINNDHGTAAKKPVAPTYKSQKYLPYQPGLPGVGQKRPPSGLSHPPPKKVKTGSLRDVSMSEAGKFATLEEYAFFDRVRKALKSPEVYDNFLRCLVLYNQEVINRSELIQLTGSFLNRHPDLFKWFKNFLGHRESQQNDVGIVNSGTLGGQMGGRGMSGETAMEIDYATCKRLGKSYCALPKDFVQPVCSGRTELCRSVLNDTWVSFPSWSEDSQFVTSRKTQFEEFIYRTEDERFEFDIVLETNKDTIKVLECVQKKMSRMPPEEAARYRLDDCLGGSSPTIHQRAIRRIYGDKSTDIIEGLKRNPVVAVPLVLRRLRAKDEEWREVQKNFNRVWRDQNEKYYLKSLDHQYLQFKQSDTRGLRSKFLLTEIETLYDERHEQQEESAGNNPGSSGSSTVPLEGPHLTLEYPDMKILDDANNILIHHVKRQTSVHKDDKQKIKLLLRHYLMDIFKHPRQDLSEDERENDPHDEDNSSNNESDNNSKATRSDRARKKKDDKSGNKKDDRAVNKKSGDKSPNKDEKPVKEEIIKEADIKIENKDGRQTPIHARDMDADETYVHIMCNNHWYLFIRLHQILCERLTKMYNQAVIIASEEAKDKKDRKTSTAVALKLKPKSEIDPEDYYPAFLDMVKNLLDGNMDGQTYEDTLREMFGIHAFISFTLDKVVGNAVRQLQYLVTDESCVECFDLYQSENKNGATGGYCGTAAERQIAELLYQKRAEKLLADENCMKVIVYHQSGKVTIEMLDTDTEVGDFEQEEKRNAPNKYLDSYVDRFIQPGVEVSAECKRHLAQKPVFLPRSIRCYNTSPLGRVRSAEVGQDVVLENGKEIKKEKREDVKKGIPDVINEDNTQCVFNPKNFKILYVVNSESCFYRKLALTRGKMSHKKVSQRKTADFNRWHSKWLKKNVSESQQTSLNDWFMGKCDGLVPNKTHKITKSDHDTTPYRTFHRFRAEILKT